MARRFFLPLLFIFLFSSFSFSQNAIYEDDSGWRLGFNIGGAWQGKPFGEVDIRPTFGGGLGFTFGKMIYRKKGRFFSLGLRGRFLWLSTTGQDLERSYGLDNNYRLDGRYAPGLNYKDDPGFVYHNYKMEGREYSLEGMLVFNQLLERTNVLLYGFGAVGLVNYQVDIDQLDENGRKYDYSSIDPNASKGNIKSDLRSIRDGKYETRAVGGNRENDFMPSVGLGLGYQFSPHVSLVLEHKVTFGLTDHMDGVRWQENQVTTRNDIYHYTALGFRLGFGKGGGSSSSAPDDRPPQDVAENPDDDEQGEEIQDDDSNVAVGEDIAQKVEKPTIEYLNPASTPHTVKNGQFRLKAKILRVIGEDDITLRVNADPQNQLNFNTNNNVMVATVPLSLGSNHISISAENQGGKAKKVVILIREEEEEQDPAPVVGFTSPSSNPEYTEKDSWLVKADVLNVDGKEDITFKINGKEKNFSFNPSTGLMRVGIRVEKGANVMEIVAENDAGKDAASTTLIQKKEEEEVAPQIHIRQPSQNPYRTSQGQFNVTADVVGVESTQGLQVKVNGSSFRNFSFDPSSGRLQFSISLIEGTNMISVTATNKVGKASDSGRIIYEVQQKEDAPVVRILDPSRNPVTKQKNVGVVKGKIRNVQSRNDVQVRVNGRKFSNYNFNASTGRILIRKKMVQGNNVFEISAKNSGGSDEASTVIKYEKPMPPVSIDVTNPSNNPHTVNTSGKFPVQAHIRNVKGKGDIQYNVNGGTIRNFTYNTSNDRFLHRTRLKKGKNVLRIQASNNASQAIEKLVIHYNPLKPPKIKILKPASDPHETESNRGIVQGRVSNISDKNQLTIKQEGNVVSGINFNPSNGQFIYRATLSKGENQFNIKAVNNAGSDSKNLVIKRVSSNSGGGGGGQVYSMPPDILISQPSSSPHSANSSSYTMKGRVMFINASSAIEVKHNGNSVNFQFDPNANNGLTIPLNLKNGNNTIEIEATNNYGTVSENFTIQYSGAQQPQQDQGEIQGPPKNR